VDTVSPVPEWDDTDYATLAQNYAIRRRPDPAIAAQLQDALGTARTVINVGAGTGSYEPTDRYVVAVEPSAQMRAGRPTTLPPALDARAEALPFDDDAFDAALAVLTIHHWSNLAAGLRELRRVARGPVVILTADPQALSELWLPEYAPEFHEVELRRYPPLDRIREYLGGAIEVRVLRIPLLCLDGFADAFYGRPELMLEQATRQAQSAWTFVPAEAQARFERRLSADLASGAWDARWGRLRTLPTFEGSMRILIATYDQRRASPGLPGPLGNARV
jgi:SAM-dependent methyltransferase